MNPSNEDLKAAAELALEDPNCSVIKVATAIREHFGWRSAVEAVHLAKHALWLVNTDRAVALIRKYELTHAANVAAMNRNY